MPRALPTEVPDAISKVEMSAATIATLRKVMQEMENGMLQKKGKAELVAKKKAREALEAHARH